MRDLRTRDPWDAAQTHESLRPYLNEEAHELDDAIRDGEDDAMRSELGDVLLQVLFHAIVAEERGAFDVRDVAGSLVHKMRTRHPQLVRQRGSTGRATGGVGEDEVALAAVARGGTSLRAPRPAPRAPPAGTRGGGRIRLARHDRTRRQGA